jgi:hypothetical protein
MTPGGPMAPPFAAFHPPSMRSHPPGIPMPTRLFHPHSTFDSSPEVLMNTAVLVSSPRLAARKLIMVRHAAGDDRLSASAPPFPATPWTWSPSPASPGRSLRP